MQIVFPKVPTENGKGLAPPQAYIVQRSNSASFKDIDPVPNTYIDNGQAFVAIDLRASWSGDTRPYYRVAIVDQSGEPVTVSKEAQPVDQLGTDFNFSKHNFVSALLASFVIK